MVNTHKKGQRKELLAQKELEKEGYTVVFKSYTIKLGPIFKGIDFADLFDVIAIKDKQWCFISVKHRGYYSLHEEEIREFGRKHILQGMVFELWIWNEPRWTGRGKNKKWSEAHWDKVILCP